MSDEMRDGKDGGTGDEKMRRQMEFIVNQQAQFAADIQQLQESQSRLTDAVVAVVGMVGKLAEAQGQMAEAQARAAAEYAEFRKQTEVRFAELAASHAETDVRLNSLINVVERYISEQRNGRARGGGGAETPPNA